MIWLMGLDSVPLASVTQYNLSFRISFIALHEKNEACSCVYFQYSETNCHLLQQLPKENETFASFAKLNNVYFVSTEKTTTYMKKLQTRQYLCHCNLVSSISIKLNKALF